ncbi:hypothetical protein Pla108_04730 [Botrimarina colliarenosi]|uniref:Cytochrome C n=1 Tax=Botrimarina colliarenosi TaxID=2528001 RepID=A0A5C6AKI3_9BACT|nr:hypothetical protein [Botrimarina colliarenosi]TWT99531.1 hypothetical protein Pla108_04730 [Botrimarina colliarenosi]
MPLPRMTAAAVTLLGAAVAQAASPQRIESPPVPNLVRVHPKVLSGGAPEGDTAFAALSRLGVKTVISVDAAQPDLAAAARHGLRYIHLPHGYDGVPAERAAQLAKAVRDLEGPVYVHCHHGKHRSPAAAAVACVTAGMMEPADAPGVLELAGTSPSYRGLFASAREARPLNPATLDRMSAEFPESVEAPPMAAAMVAIEQTHDRLKTLAAAGWRAPRDHPDLDPGHEALLLREHFTELLRSDAVAGEPAEFLRMLRESEAAAIDLETTLGTPSIPAEKAAVALQRINANCVNCHERYRDVPLGEK